LGFFAHISSVISFMQLPRERRRVVFYSEGPAYWTHLQGLLERFLDTADVPVCYFSSSPQDPGLGFSHPALKTFLIDEAWVRDWFFANVDTDLLVMTMPDLHQYQLKRSRHRVHYVYVQHSLVSQHMAYKPGAFDHFDTVFCAGPHHVAEIRALEEQRGTPAKNLVEHGYQRLDAILANRPNEQVATSIPEAPHVLIAPSWGPNGIIEKLGNAPIEALLQAGMQVTLRPHPQTIRKSPKDVDEIVQRHRQNSSFAFDDDASSTASLQASDLMISDWSGASLDYAFGLGKPVVFIDTPPKVNNPDYEQLDIEPFESRIRTAVGEVVAEADLGNLSAAVHRQIGNATDSRLSAVADEHVFNLGRSSDIGVEALRNILAEAAS
jgi:hypothetical protein